MKKSTSALSVILAIILALSCFSIFATAATATLSRIPEQNTFYQGIDWMYNQQGSIILIRDLNLSGAAVTYNNVTIEYKKGVTGPNMYSKPVSGSWVPGKNTIKIFCDAFDSDVYATFDVTFACVKSISIVKTPKTKLIRNKDWQMGRLNDVEMIRFDLTGTIIEATYDNSDKKEVSYPNASMGWSIPENTDIVMPGAGTLYVSFCGKKAPFSVNYIVQTDFPLGDVNLDNQINSYDALNVLQCATDSLTLSAAQIELGDVDKNGSLNSSDALRILQYVVGNIKKF